MTESNDRQRSGLQETYDLIKQVYDRAFTEVSSAAVPSPDKKKDKPMDLAVYQSACLEADVEVLLPERIKNDSLHFIRNADTKALFDRYQPGSTICLALMPQLQQGVPTMKFYELFISKKGLTSGYTSDPAYYFLNFPEVVQKDISLGGCSFTVPFFDYFSPRNGGNGDELKQQISNFRRDLEASYTAAWGNLEKLVKPEKRAA